MKGLLFQTMATAVGFACLCGVLQAEDDNATKPKTSAAGIPYVTDQNQAGLEELIGAIRNRRFEGKLLNVDRMLLNSPSFARGWNELIGAVRSKMTLPPILRELAIMAVGVLNGADYEYAQHRPEFLAAGGTTDQLAALTDVADACRNAKLFNESERASLMLAYEMTRNVKVSKETLARVRALMPDQQVVELAGTIAAYNMVSRFLVALGIQLE
jgi:alkylhydroperoxidase family enzyme